MLVNIESLRPTSIPSIAISVEEGKTTAVYHDKFCFRHQLSTTEEGGRRHQKCLQLSADFLNIPVSEDEVCLTYN